MSTFPIQHTATAVDRPLPTGDVTTQVKDTIMRSITQQQIGNLEEYDKETDATRNVLQKRYSIEKIVQALHTIITEQNPLSTTNLQSLQQSALQESVFPYTWMLLLDQAYTMLNELARKGSHAAKETLHELFQKDVPQSLPDALDALNSKLPQEPNDLPECDSYTILHHIFNNIHPKAGSHCSNANTLIFKLLCRDSHPSAHIFYIHNLFPLERNARIPDVIRKFEHCLPCALSSFNNLTKLWSLTTKISNQKLVQNAIQRKIMQNAVSKENLENTMTWLSEEQAELFKNQILQPLAIQGCPHAISLLEHCEGAVDEKAMQKVRNRKLALEGDPIARDLLLKEFKHEGNFNNLLDILKEHAEKYTSSDTFASEAYLFYVSATHMLEEEAIESADSLYFNLLGRMVEDSLWLALTVLQRLACHPNERIAHASINTLLGSNKSICKTKLKMLAEDPSCPHRDFITQQLAKRSVQNLGNGA